MSSLKNFIHKTHPRQREYQNCHTSCDSAWSNAIQKYWRHLASVLFCLFILQIAHAQNNVPIHPVDGEYIKEWLVLGPFFPDDLEKDFLVDVGGEANIEPEAGNIVVTAQGDTLTWKRYQTNWSAVDLLDVVGKNKHATAYAFCTLRSETEEKTQILLGSNDGASVRINGKQVHHNPVNRWLTLDEDMFAADLLAGVNRCLVKVTQNIGGWSFAMRAFPHNQPVFATPQFFLSSDDLELGIPLSEGLWKYHPGNNDEWAQSDFDDRSWELVEPELRQNKSPISGWNGIGWFRLHLAVDSTLWNRPLALNVRQLGAASEIYLDGALLAQFGKVGSSKQDEEGYITSNTNFLPPPKSVVFSKTHHVIAVRLSNFHFIEIYPQQWQGFGIGLSQLNSAITLGANQRRANITIQMVVTIVPIVFAIFHLLLFLFYQRAKENLYYSLFTLLLGVTLFAACQVGFSLVTELGEAILFIKLTQVIFPFAFIAGLRFLYAIFYPKLPKQFWIFLLIGAGWAAWQWLYLFSLWQLGTGLILIMLFEMFRVAVVAIRRKKDGAWIIGTGFIFFTIGFIGGILAQIANLPNNLTFMNASYISGLFGLLLSISVFLARNISRTEVDNARKTLELEEARKLQLSMLPATVPTHPNLEIAAYMQTATEVGGDYYDFKLHDDGTLTAVIGDATGHGLQAGTMVSATKSLFHALADEPEPIQFIKKGTEAIKAMGLKKMFMALTIAKFKNHHIQIAAAGMPYPLVYRSSTGRVEEVALKGMPLGGFADFTYKDKELHLNTGDTVLFMSDGFEEMFNPQDEMLGEEQVKILFKETAAESPEKIIEHLKKAGEAWANGRNQQDDVTFVVVKMK